MFEVLWCDESCGTFDNCEDAKEEFARYSAGLRGDFLTEWACRGGRKIQIPDDFSCEIVMWDETSGDGTTLDYASFSYADYMLECINDMIAGDFSGVIVNDYYGEVHDADHRFICRINDVAGESQAAIDAACDEFVDECLDYCADVYAESGSELKLSGSQFSALLVGLAGQIGYPFSKNELESRGLACLLAYALENSGRA